MFEQERFVGRLQRHVMAERAVSVCFLSGSFGRRAEDGYSDVDVVLVYDDEVARATAWEEREAFVRAVMPYVPARSFDAVHVRPHLHVALYSNGTKADYLFESRETMEPAPWQREIRVLKERDGWADDYQAASARLALPQPYLSGAELTEIDNRFWAMLWDVLRQLKRGDADKPFPIYLELLYHTLPPLVRTLPPEDPAYAPLIGALYSADTEATAAGVAALLEHYLAARTAIVRRQNLVFAPDAAFEAEMRRQVQKLAG